MATLQFRPPVESFEEVNKHEENSASVNMESNTIGNLFSSVIDCTSSIHLRIGERDLTSLAGSCMDESLNLTDWRQRQAQRVLENVFAVNGKTLQTCITTRQEASPEPCCVIGPVINPSTNKKDTAITLKEYIEFCKVHIKPREQHGGVSDLHHAMTQNECIARAVVCYDFFHKDITKPVCRRQQEAQPDSLFRDAVKVLYNRSRVWCILENFQTGVESQLYPALPPLESTDFALLKHDAELIIIRKYVSGFTDLVKKCDEKHLPKIIPNLWRFLLLLSQHYSVYYSSVRTLCDEHSISYSTMHARIWMLKCILSMYDGILALLDLKPLDYV